MAGLTLRTCCSHFLSCKCMAGWNTTQKRHLERVCFWKWFEGCCGGMNQGDLWFSFPNGGVLNTFYGQEALAEAEKWEKPEPSIILWQTSPDERWSNPETHTYWALCIHAGEINVLCYLAAKTEQSLQECPVCSGFHSLCCCSHPRGREFVPPGAGLQPSLAPAPPGRSESTAPLGSPRGSVSCQGQDNTPGHTQPFPLAQLPKKLINTENRVCF